MIVYTARVIDDEVERPDVEHLCGAVGMVVCRDDQCEEREHPMICTRAYDHVPDLHIAGAGPYIGAVWAAS
jgi:hypothetical protein